MRRSLRSVAIISLLALSGFLGVVSNPLPVYSQAADDSLQGSFDFVDEVEKRAEVKRFDSATDLIFAILGVFLSIVTVIAAAAIIWGGFTYITAAGDEGKAARAKMTILYAIIGLLIIGAAAIIVNVVVAIYSTDAGG